MSRTLIALLLAFGCTGAWSQPIWAPDWITLVPDGVGYGGREPVAVVDAVARDPATGSVHLLGNGVIRLSAEGVVEYVGRWTWPRFDPSPLVASATVTSNGDVVVSADQHCTLAALDRTGAVRWWWRPESWNRVCSPPMPVDDSVLSVERVSQGGQTATQLVRFLADGRRQVVADLDIGEGELFQLHRAPGTGTMVLSWGAPSGPGSPESALHLMALGDDGREQWRWRWLRVGDQQRSLRVTAEGGVQVFGIDGGRHTLVTLGNQGQELYRRIWSPEDGFRAQHGLLAQHGGLYLMDWSHAQMRQRVRMIEPAGTEAWRSDREGPFCGPVALHCRALLTDDGDLILTGGHLVNETRIERYGPDGGLRFEHVFPDPFAPDLHPEDHRARIHPLAGGDLLQLRGMVSSSYPRLSQPVIQILDRAGTPGPAITLPARPREYFDHEAAVAYSDERGWSFVVVDGNPALLTAIRPSGTRAWTVPLSSTVGLPTVGPPLLASCGEEGVAVALLDGIACHERSTGSRRWHAPGQSGLHGRKVYALAGGRLLAAQIEFGRNVLLDTVSGGQVTSLDPYGRPLAVHRQRGAAFRGAGGRIVVITPQGQLSELAGAGLVPIDAHSADLGPDGELTLARAAASDDGTGWRLEVWRVGGGALRWHRVVEGIPCDQEEAPVRTRALAEGDVAVIYACSTYTDGVQARDQVRVGLLRLTSGGETRWQRQWWPATFDDVLVAGEHAGRILLAATRPETHDLLLSVLDGVDGSTVRMVQVDCPDLACGNDNVRVLPDGAVMVAGRSWGPTGLDVPVQRLSGLLAMGPDVALGQPGLGGQWYAEHSGGQGLALSWFGSARTLFLPWFTFDRQGGNDPRHQRWYTLQAQLPPGASRADLAILQSVGGRFDRPGSTLEAVGQAHLRMQSCRDGVLEYRFDGAHNGGAQGTIALRRLLPAGAACIGAEGVQEPAPVSADPAYTGHWFDPAAPGQGLDVQRIAPGAGSPGALFATWFTYDPVAPVGQPEDQHWFTLQGQELVDGSAIRTTIVQTISGRFDDRPTANHHRVGEAVLRPLACDRLRLSYRFDDTDLAGAYRELAGHIDLHRLGDCP